jgi:hypothetical protein
MGLLAIPPVLSKRYKEPLFLPPEAMTVPSLRIAIFILAQGGF